MPVMQPGEGECESKGSALLIKMQAPSEKVVTNLHLL
jgi:hypothetical protein